MLSAHARSTPEAPCQHPGAAKLCPVESQLDCDRVSLSRVPKLPTSQAAITLQTQVRTSGRGPQLERHCTHAFQHSFAKSPCSAPEPWSWPGTSMC